MFAVVVHGTPPLFHHEVAAVPPISFEGLTGKVKDEIRQVLFGAQGGRCCYCEEVIKLDSAVVKIEHFHPQNAGVTGTGGCRRFLGVAGLRRSDVEWKNLLLSCSGGEKQERTAARYCDTAKGGADICEVWYSNRESLGPNRSLVKVSRQGRVTPAYFPASRESAQNVLDNVYKINARYMQDNRAQVFEQVLDRFNDFKAKYHRAHRSSTMAEIRSEFAKRLRMDADARKEYPSTLESAASFVEKGYKP